MSMDMSFKNYIETYADMGLHLGEYDVLNVKDKIAAIMPKSQLPH